MLVAMNKSEENLTGVAQAILYFRRDIKITDEYFLYPSLSMIGILISKKVPLYNNMNSSTKQIK